MKSCMKCSLVFVLCCISTALRAEMLIGNSGACFESDMHYLMSSSCESNENQRTAHSRIRGFFYGQIIKHIWKSPTKQAIQNQTNNETVVKPIGIQSEEKIHHQSALQKMLNAADFDLDASSHRMILSIKMRF